MEYSEPEKFIHLAATLPVIDTRSPSEYTLGHFPGAENVPLLNDEVRKEVGTAYKQQGREEAVEVAFRLVGPQFSQFILDAKKIAPGKNILIYCWRGGMRSNTMAWVLGMAGFKVTLMKGGYKAYRNWVLQRFGAPRKLIVLGGKTGCGKTEILEQLRKNGEQVINLEALASHKGSAFGAMGMDIQPSHQQFENLLAMHWDKLDSNRLTWVENESRQIGTKIIPDKIYDLMRSSPVIELGLPIHIRAKRILEEYGKFPVAALSENTMKLQKRLGIQRATEAVNFLHSKELEKWLDIVLDYYDKTYEHSSAKRNPENVFPLESATDDVSVNAELLTNFVNTQQAILFR